MIEQYAHLYASGVVKHAVTPSLACTIKYNILSPVNYLKSLYPVQRDTPQRLIINRRNHG